MVTETTPTPPSFVITQKPNPVILTIILIIVILLGTTSVLAYQNYQLKKRLSFLQLTPLPQPETITPTPSPTFPTSPLSAPDAASPKPAPIIKPSTTPQPVTLDLFFDSPASYIARGYDKGDGKGLISEGQFSGDSNHAFDELNKLWASPVSACFQIKTNQAITGSEISYQLFLDNTKIREDHLGNYSLKSTGYGLIATNTANSVVPFCQQVDSSVGNHSVKLVLNSNKSTSETNYSNNTAEATYQIKADSVPPAFNIYGPNKETEGTCVFINDVSDNISNYSDLTIIDRLDNNSWGNYHYPRYCVAGTTGEQHTYYVKITDLRGNTAEKSKTFQIL